MKRSILIKDSTFNKTRSNEFISQIRHSPVQRAHRFTVSNHDNFCWSVGMYCVPDQLSDRLVRRYFTMLHHSQLSERERREGIIATFYLTKIFCCTVKIKQASKDTV